MKAKDRDQQSESELRAEYHFDYSKSTRGKYYKHLITKGANVVVLEPDVAKKFPDSTAVNNALRSLMSSTEPARRATRRSAGPTKQSS